MVYVKLIWHIAQRHHKAYRLCFIFLWILLLWKLSPNIATPCPSSSMLHKITLWVSLIFCNFQNVFISVGNTYLFPTAWLGNNITYPKQEQVVVIQWQIWMTMDPWVCMYSNTVMRVHSAQALNSQRYTGNPGKLQRAEPLGDRVQFCCREAKRQ